MSLQVTEEGEDGSTAPTLQQIEENVQNWGQEDRGASSQEDRGASSQEDRGARSQEDPRGNPEEEGVTDVVARTSSEP